MTRSLEQIIRNINEVRNHHKASTAPKDPESGTMWLDDSGTPWILKMYDATDDEWKEVTTVNGVSLQSVLLASWF